MFKRLDLITLVQIALTLGIAALGFMPAFHAHINNEVAYAIARGAGASLKLLIPFIFIPTLRMFHAKAYPYLQKLSKIPIIGKLFHNRISLHKILGLAILTAGISHAGAHFFRYSVAFLSQEALTGILMLTLMLGPIGAMYVMRSYHFFQNKIFRNSTYFSQFVIPHQLGWWGLLLLYAFHTHDLRLMASSLLVFGIFSFDRVWEWVKSYNQSVKNVQKIHEKMIVVEIEKPRDYRYKTGEKAYLAFPPGFAFFNNLHPFTIASSPDENVLRFVISDSGEWSHNLIANLQVGDKVKITPAFPSPLDTTSARDAERLMVSSGAGLAVTIAKLHDKTDQTPISIIHTSRYREEFSLLKFHMNNNPNVKAAEFYETGNNAALPISGDTKNASVYAGRFVPAQNAKLKAFKGRVVFCGNDDLGDKVEETTQGVSGKILFREKFSV